MEQPFTRDVCTFDYVIIGLRFFFTCLCAGIPLTLDFGKYRQNWLKQAINRKRVIQAIREIVRILLLPWIEWIMIQVIERYETNGFFSFQISWIPCITDPSVQTNRHLMSIKWTLRINFKAIFAKIPILYAWLHSELAFEACFSNI